MKKGEFKAVLQDKNTYRYIYIYIYMSLSRDIHMSVASRVNVYYCSIISSSKEFLQLSGSDH